MSDSVVVVYYKPDPLPSNHLFFKKSNSKPALELAKEIKGTSFGENVFIEEEGRPATKKVGCDLCDDRTSTPFVER